MISTKDKALTLGVVLKGLLNAGMTEREIMELLSANNIRGGLKILRGDKTK